MRDFLSSPYFNLVCALIGALIGGVVTLVVTWIFHRRAEKNLKNKVDEILKPTKLILEALEVGGIANYSRDKNGNIKSVTLKIKAHDAVHVVTDSGPIKLELNTNKNE